MVRDQPSGDLLDLRPLVHANALGLMPVRHLRRPKRSEKQKDGRWFFWFQEV